MKHDSRPALRSARLLDRLRERIRYCHYSIGIKVTHVHWVPFNRPYESGPDEQVT